MFIVEITVTIQWKVLGPVVYQEGLYFIELVITKLWTLFINYLQTRFKTLKWTCKLGCEVHAQFSNLGT